jgi:hypothetical protein
MGTPSSRSLIDALAQLGPQGQVSAESDLEPAI